MEIKHCTNKQILWWRNVNNMKKILVADDDPIFLGLLP